MVTRTGALGRSVLQHVEMGVEVALAHAPTHLQAQEEKTAHSWGLRRKRLDATVVDVQLMAVTLLGALMAHVPSLVEVDSRLVQGIAPIHHQHMGERTAVIWDQAPLPENATIWGVQLMGVIVAGLLGAIVLSRAEGVARLAAGFVPIHLHNMGEKIALALDLQFKPSSVVQMIAL